jgi:hypothetical protein
MSTRQKICAMHMASSEIVTFKAVLNILLIKLCYFNAHLFYSSVNDEMLRFPPFTFCILFYYPFSSCCITVAGGLFETHVSSRSNIRFFFCVEARVICSHNPQYFCYIFEPVWLVDCLCLWGVATTHSDMFRHFAQSLSGGKHFHHLT